MAKNKSMSSKVKALLVGAGVLAAGLSGAALGANLMPREVPVEVEVPYEVVINNTQTIEKEVEVEVEVPVPNPVNDKLLQYIQDNVNEDLTKELVLFEFGAQADSEVFIEDNMISLLRENDFFRSGRVFEDYRTSEVSVWRVSNSKIDFHMMDDKRLDVSMDVRVRANRPNSNAQFIDFEVIIPFHRGEMVTEDITVVEK